MSMYGRYPKVLVDGKLVEQNGFNGGPKAWPTTDCSEDPPLTVQSQANECDINKIMKRVEKGQLVKMTALEGRFEDISDLEGLAEAVIKVKRAEKDFMTLPAEVRSRFRNNPTELVEFLENPENRQEAEKLGLVKPKEIPPVPATIQPAGGAQ